MNERIQKNKISKILLQMIYDILRRKKEEDQWDIIQMRQMKKNLIVFTEMIGVEFETMRRNE